MSRAGLSSGNRVAGNITELHVAAQGGKNSRDPILREDVLLQRVPQMRAQKKEDADPFAPEYSAETWYQKSSALPAHVRAAAASLDNWKRNPNERRHVRTNRRK